MRLLTLLVLVFGGCTAYEYEEEVFLEVDGSGRLRVSGSSAILESLYDVDGAAPQAFASLFEGPGFEVDSVRRTERNGRHFVHVEGRFAEWDEVCARAVFRTRECRLTTSDDGTLALLVQVPPPEGDLPHDIPPDARIALRFHFPSAVTFHNAPGGIERGNIIGWERSVAEHFDAPAMVVEARFEQRSVLATTVGILGTAAGTVFVSVALALFLIARKGRQQLAEEAEN